MWPEAALTATYATVFDTTSGPGVSDVKLTLSDSSSTLLSEAVLLDDYTAVSFSTMIAAGYSDKTPASVNRALTVAMTDATTVTVDEYLWLFRKSTSSAGVTDDSRTVVVFKLTGATEDIATTPDSLILNYAQIF